MNDALDKQFPTTLDTLGVVRFDKAFDDHFGVQSSLLSDAILHGKGKGASATRRCACFPGLKKRPDAWGITVRLLWRLWEYISQDMHDYAAAHSVDSSRNHVCLVSPCNWAHYYAKTVSRHEVGGFCKDMKKNMHLVVRRYIKPLTLGLDSGLALALNAAMIATIKGLSHESFCFPEIFISHSWSEEFEDFAKTLRGSLDPTCVVWVCSFALDQHGDISSSLASVDECPFAKAMKRAHRVLAVTDHSAEAFSRCWVVFEAELARKWNKPYDISLPDNANVDLWRAVGNQLKTLDVAQCSASHEQDKEQILAYARQGEDGIHGLNEKVKGIAKVAMRRAELLATVANGDLDKIHSETHSLTELTDWRSIQGRSVTHIAAQHARIAVLVELIERTDYAHIDLPDGDEHTPLNVAIEGGELAAVEALICLRADVLKSGKGGLMPLHFAAAFGHNKICDRLIRAKADPCAKGVFEGQAGYTPLAAAATRGHAEVVKTLAAHRACIEVRGSDGFSPLHKTAIEGHADAAVALLSVRAQVDGPDTDSHRTSLMLACLFGRLAVVNVLLGARAAPEATTRESKSVWDYCDKCAKTNPDVAGKIKELLSRHTSIEKIESRPSPIQVEIQAKIAEMFDTHVNGTIPREVLEQIFKTLSEDSIDVEGIRSLMDTCVVSDGTVDYRLLLSMLFERDDFSPIVAWSDGK